MADDFIASIRNAKTVAELSERIKNGPTILKTISNNHMAVTLDRIYSKIKSNNFNYSKAKDTDRDLKQKGLKEKISGSNDAARDQEAIFSETAVRREMVQEGIAEGEICHAIRDAFIKLTGLEQIKLRTDFLSKNIETAHPNFQQKTSKETTAPTSHSFQSNEDLDLNFLQKLKSEKGRHIIQLLSEYKGELKDKSGQPITGHVMDGKIQVLFGTLLKKKALSHVTGEEIKDEISVLTNNPVIREKLLEYFTFELEEAKKDLTDYFTKKVKGANSMLELCSLINEGPHLTTKDNKRALSKEDIIKNIKELSNEMIHQKEDLSLKEMADNLAAADVTNSYEIRNTVIELILKERNAIAYQKEAEKSGQILQQELEKANNIYDFFHIISKAYKGSSSQINEMIGNMKKIFEKNESINESLLDQNLVTELYGIREKFTQLFNQSAQERRFIKDLNSAVSGEEVIKIIQDYNGPLDLNNYSSDYGRDPTKKTKAELIAHLKEEMVMDKAPAERIKFLKMFSRINMTNTGDEGKITYNYGLDSIADKVTAKEYRSYLNNLESKHKSEVKSAQTYQALAEAIRNYHRPISLYREYGRAAIAKDIESLAQHYDSKVEAHILSELQTEESETDTLAFLIENKLKSLKNASSQLRPIRQAPPPPLKRTTAGSPPPLPLKKPSLNSSAAAPQALGEPSKSEHQSPKLLTPKPNVPIKPRLGMGNQFNKFNAFVSPDKENMAPSNQKQAPPPLPPRHKPKP